MVPKEAPQKLCKQKNPAVNRKKQESITHAHWVKTTKEDGPHTAGLSGKEDTWDEGGREKEEGEVFTLRVLIHYRRAEARSVTLSQ